MSSIHHATKRIKKDQEGCCSVVMEELHMVEDAQLLPNSLSVCARNGNKDLQTPLISYLSSVGSSHMRKGTHR